MSYIGKKPVDFNDVTESQTFTVTGDLTVDTNTLYVDSTNSRVGVGNASPATALDVTGAVTIRDATEPSLRFLDSDSANSDFTIYSPAGEDKLRIKNQSTDRISITSAGIVTIGADSGDAFNADSILRIQRTGDRVFQQFKCDADQNVQILFGDVDDAVECSIQYHPSDKDLRFATGNNNEAMRIDSSGNVGIGTSSDLYAGVTIVDTNYTTSSLGRTGLHMRGSASANGNYTAAVSFTNEFRDGHAAIAGVAENADNDVMGLAFFTHSSTGGSNPTAESMRIDSSGNLLVGATATSQILNGSVNGAYLSGSGNSAFARNNTLNRAQIAFYNPNGAVGQISTSGSATTYSTSSDYRLKENVSDITDGIERVKQLNPSRFNFIADASTTVDGFLAHEAAIVVPEAVIGTHNEVETWTQDEIDAGDAPANTSAGDNKLDSDGNTIPVYQGIDQSKLVPLLTAALQEAITKIETLETQRADLETRLTTLENT